MKNFYYVLTYNINHERVKNLTSSISAISESMLELRIKSKLYMSYNSAAENLQADFERKAKQMFTEAELTGGLPITVNVMMNPAFMIDADPESQPKVTWEETCCCKMYYIETNEDDDEEQSLHTPWMFKYEVHVTDDAIDMNKSTYKNQLLSMNLGLASSTYQ